MAGIPDLGFVTDAANMDRDLYDDDRLDQRLPVTDWTSVVICKELGIGQMLSFEKRLARYVPLLPSA